MTLEITDIHVENRDGEYGAWTVLTIRVGKTTLRTTYSPPWDEIDREARERVAYYQQNPEDAPDYGKTMPYWWHRDRAGVSKLQEAKQALLRNAVVLQALQADATPQEKLDAAMMVLPGSAVDEVGEAGLGGKQFVIYTGIEPCEP